MTNYLLSTSKSLYGSWRSRMSPKISAFVDGLNSDNNFLDKGLRASLGLGETRFFCFGSWDGLRSAKQQEELYCNGRKLVPVQSGNYWIAVDSPSVYWNHVSPEGKVVTDAGAGASFHNWGGAIDVYLCDKNGRVDWSQNYSRLWEQLGLVEYGKSCGLRWGGSWGDNGHFEDSSIVLPSVEARTITNIEKGYLFINPSFSSSSTVAGDSGKARAWWLLAVGALAVACFGLGGFAKIKGWFR